MKILAIGAHPDDVEFGCGGTLLLLKQAGHQIKIIDLTRGEAAKFGADQRLKEAAAGAAIMGLERETLDWGDKKIEVSEKYQKLANELVARHHPDLIFAPYIIDDHPDHQNSGQLFTSFPGVIHYFIINQLNPTHGVDITAVYDQKYQAVNAHVSQIRPGDNEWMGKRNQKSGQAVGSLNGELFNIPRPITNLPDIFRQLQQN